MFLCLMSVKARELVFSPVEDKGLRDNFIVSIAQFKDGHIVAVSNSGIGIFDGTAFHSIRKDKAFSMPLPGYHGAYHLYPDSNNRLWVKDYGRMWCYMANLKSVTFHPTYDDLFADDNGVVYPVHQNNVKMLLDLKIMDGLRYEFYSSGTVECYKGRQLQYCVKAGMIDSVATTSLVVSDTIRKKFYQIVDGRQCLEFDTNTRNWMEIFRARELHTISIISPQLAYIVSKDGIWEIDLDSRKTRQVEQVELNDGQYISSSRLNTVFTDRDGNVWLGSYDRGLLRGHWVTPWYQQWWAVTAACLLLCAIVSCVTMLYIRWNRRREQRLIEIIQQLLVDNDDEADRQTIKDNAVPQPEYAELVERTKEIIRANIGVHGYTVERLAQDMCMERTGLYKKINAAIGKSPSALIRQMRIERAMQLIREGNTPIGEVARLTGFSSTSYLMKCLQEHLGCKPNEINNNIC